MRKSILILVAMLCFFRSSYGATLFCGKDLDGDGTATGQGETAPCAGDSGTLCPIDAQGCTSATSDPVCPAGGSFVAADDQCEASVPVACSLTGEAYDTMGSCTAACSEATACTLDPVSLSGSVSGYLTGVVASGTTLTFLGQECDDWSCWQASLGSITVNGATVSGSLSGALQGVVASGTTLTFLGQQCDDWSCWQASLGSITVNGATVSGSLSGALQGVVASGTTLTFLGQECDDWSCWQASLGSITVTAATYSCPYGTSYGCDANQTCTQTGTCSVSSCPTGYSWNGNCCAASPQCSGGTYSATDKECHSSTYTCPYGSAYACINNQGVLQCSPTSCFDPNAPGNQILQTQDSSMLQNDGQRDDQGNCLGDLYIFSGRSMECNTSGQGTGWKNCCMSGAAPLADDLGSASSMMGTFNTITNVYHMGQIAYYGNMVSGLGDYGVQMIGSFNVSPEVSNALATVAQTGDIAQGLTTYAEAAFLDPTTMAIGAALYLVQDFLLSGSCSQDDLQTAMLDDSGMCHYIDTYCKKKWPLVGCVQEAKVFCCFNSKLARIVQEQGRPQLATFNPPWVYAGSGNCRGLTPSEFQMLDFSKMDLSEYLGDIKAKAQATLQNTINDKINQYYQKTQP